MSAIATTPATSGACCAQMYEKDWVQQLLGDSMHPGGLALSRRVWASLPLGQPGLRIADVACGTGTTAVALATEHGTRVVAIDLGADNLAKTEARAAEAGVLDQIQCIQADARKLPLEDNSLDGLICECAVSTFADKQAVIAEFARMVRPGGVIAISDMVVEGEIPADLAGLLAPWTCVGDALSVDGYQRLFLDAGLRSMATTDETAALHELLLDLKRKLVMAAVGGMAAGLADLGIGVSEARRLLAESKELVDAGTVQYTRMSFSKGRPTVAPRPEATTSQGCDPSTGCCG